MSSMNKSSRKVCPSFPQSLFFLNDNICILFVHLGNWSKLSGRSDGGLLRDPIHAVRGK